MLPRWCSQPVCTKAEVKFIQLSLFPIFFFFSSRRRHTRCLSDWSSDVCSSDLAPSTADVTVQWTTAAFPPRPGGAALPGAEYLERSGTAVIPAGSLYARVPLWIDRKSVV